jgi:hypothetical protein
MSTTLNIFSGQTGTTLSILKRANEILSDESKWTQGSMAKDIDHDAINIYDPAACRFCIVGSLYRAAYELKLRTSDADMAASRLSDRTSHGLTNINDRGTFKEVKELLTSCIASLEANNDSATT